MITKIGVVVNQLSPNQICYDIIKNTNDYLSRSDNVDVTLFWVNDGPRIIQPKFACMHIFEAYGFHGDVTIATSIQTASRIIDYPGPNRGKLLYWIYDIDYLRLPAQQRSWEGLSSVYLNNKLKLVSRSETHSEIINSVWRTPSGVMESFDIEKVLELIK